MKSKFLISTIVALLFLVSNSCKKKDWRDGFVGSFKAVKTYEIPIIDFYTGRHLGYSIDTILDKNANIQLSKNELNDQLTVKIDGELFMEADKNGFGPPNPLYTLEYSTDSVFIHYLNVADTVAFGRYAYRGIRN